MRERLAELAHTQWSGWMNYLFDICQFNEDGTVTIPVGLVKRWKHQAQMPYAELSETEKDSDRKEADRILEILNT